MVVPQRGGAFYIVLFVLRHHRSIVPLGSVFLLLLLKGHLLCDLPWRRESQEFLYVWPEPRRAHDVDVGHAAVGEVLRVYSSLGRALDDPGGLKGELGHNEAAKAAKRAGGQEREIERETEREGQSSVVPGGRAPARERECEGWERTKGSRDLLLAGERVQKKQRDRGLRGRKVGREKVSDRPHVGMEMRRFRVPSRHSRISSRTS